MNSNHFKVVVLSLLTAIGLSNAGNRAASEPPSATASSALVGHEDGPREVDVPGDELEVTIRAALKHLNPELAPDYIGPAPVDGYQEVIVKGQVLYVSDDGKVLAQGLIDIERKRDVAQFGAMPGRRLDALAEIPNSERIVFAPAGEIKHTVLVFTDVECGFCRKLHQDIDEYNRLGIAIEYIAFPRAGLGTPDAEKMESVWCSKDRKKALTEAKSGAEVRAPKCENPVARHHEIGLRIGLKGTPLFINSDGVAIPSYMPPEKLMETLDKLAAQRKD